jgi:Fur family ferric uptake transcriptional regulator
MQISMFPTHSAVERQAESLLKGMGPRQTGPRKRVLMFLLEQDCAVTRMDILNRMADKPIGSATLHRVLAWLTTNGLAHRVACADQSRRFSANRQAQQQEHAHFQCMRCGSVTCLHGVELPANIAVPPGFKRHEINFLVRGTCPHCGEREQP